LISCPSSDLNVWNFLLLIWKKKLLSESRSSRTCLEEPILCRFCRCSEEFYKDYGHPRKWYHRDQSTWNGSQSD
jgi:hypothetical protein